jgi:hypothetical protein
MFVPVCGIGMSILTLRLISVRIVSSGWPSRRTFKVAVPELAAGELPVSRTATLISRD